jgi:hypothetical protein
LVEITASLGGDWRLLDRQHLGLSFRLLVLLPGRRNNKVLGQRQRLSSVDVDAAARSAVFRWKTVVSEFGGEHAMNVTMRVRLDEHQARWETTLENRSELVVENVYAPYFGDVAQPPGSGTFQALVWEYMRARVWPLWPTYQNTRGYYGVDHPIQLGSRYTAGIPGAPFLLLQGKERGLYIGTGNTSPELVAWQTELVPGYGSSIDERVPVQAELSGKDVAMQVAAVISRSFSPARHASSPRLWSSRTWAAGPAGLTSTAAGATAQLPSLPHRPGRESRIPGCNSTLTRPRTNCGCDSATS